MNTNPTYVPVDQGVAKDRHIPFDERQRFSPGDRVVVTEKYPDPLYHGTVGYVTEVDPEGFAYALRIPDAVWARGGFYVYEDEVQA